MLASFGVTNIVTGGIIFKWLRDMLKPIPLIGTLIKCPMCLGFWVGIGWCLLGLSPMNGLGFFVDLMMAGFIASGSCWIIRVILFNLGEDDL
jgi:hypothetical protein